MESRLGALALFCCQSRFDRLRQLGRLGRHFGVKTLEDFADQATDDLTGWNERKQGETVKHKGAFSDLGVASDEAEALIMKARVALGWIEAPVEEVAVEEEVQA